MGGTGIIWGPFKHERCVLNVRKTNRESNLLIPGVRGLFSGLGGRMGGWGWGWNLSEEHYG